MAKNYASNKCYWRKVLDQGRIPKVSEECREAFEQFLEEYRNPKPKKKPKYLTQAERHRKYVYTAKEREEAKRRKIRQLQMRFNIKPKTASAWGGEGDKNDT